MTWEEYLAEAKKWKVARIDLKGFISLGIITPVRPKEYLDFADKDLLLENVHGYVNALSNAKRAIDCQITNILATLGFSKLGNIHKKIERIETVGILAPRILKKLNKIRNLLEHEFQKPTKDEAEDAVDIATLFLGATEKIFINFMESFWIAREGSANEPEIYKEGNKTIIFDDELPKQTFADGIYIEYDHEQCEYSLWCFLNNEEVLAADVKRGSPLHSELIRYSTTNHSNEFEYDDELVGGQFLANVESKDGIFL